MSTVTYLVTGANRGIGRNIVEILLERPDTIVVAAVRDPSSESSQELPKIKTADGTRCIVVKIDSEVDADPVTAIEQLRSEHQIQHLDIVIANAGQSGEPSKLDKASIDKLKRSFQINTVAALLLFQAVKPMLDESKTTPKFITITSNLGSIKGQDRGKAMTFGPYGAVKAALNFLTRKMHFENENMVIFPMNPGLVDTGLISIEERKRRGLDFKKMGALEPRKGAQNILNEVDKATRESHGGKYLDAPTGTELPW